MIATLLREFHEAFVPAEPDPRKGQPELLREEHKEVQQALHYGARWEIAQELADLVYVAYGTALVHGIDLDAEVHRANMSKLGENGLPILRSDGKVLKGPRYSPPDLTRACK